MMDMSKKATAIHVICDGWDHLFCVEFYIDSKSALDFLQAEGLDIELISYMNIAYPEDTH